MANPTIPSNVEAEAALIGCMFLDENLILQVIDQIVYEDFYDLKNKEIYKVIQQLHIDSKHIDVTTVSSELMATNKLELVGGLDYLSKIANITYSTANAESYIALVKEASLKRHAIEILNSLTQLGYDGSVSADRYIEKLEEQVFELSKRRKTEQFTNLSDVLSLVEENTNRSFDNEGGLTGLDTGFPELNAITLGFQKESLIILAARPAMGKSAFAMNLATQVAENNKDGKANVAVFSLEMGADQLGERMISADSLIDLTKIKKGNLSSTDWRLFDASKRKLSNLNIYFDDSSSVTVADIRTKCRKLATERGLDFVVIDYLQLVNGDETKSKQEEVSKISRNLKLMARELKIPVLALAQLSREVEKRPGKEKRPIMADLRDSGSIEQDADIVMFLYREEYYDHETARKGIADLIISKNRSGSSGKDISYQFQGQFARFTEIEETKGEIENV